jgi:hypothetical protein
MSAGRYPTKWPLGPKTTWLLIVLGTLAALAVIAVVGAALASRARWRTQLRRIESRGEPLVLPAPPTEPTAEGERTRVWLDNVQDCDGPEDEWKLGTADGLRAFQDRAEWTKLSSDDRERLERLAACLAPGARWSEHDGEALLVESLDTLLDAIPPERWEPCVRDFIRSRECAYPHLLEHLRSANTLVLIDDTPSRGIERMRQEAFRMTWVAGDALAPIGALAVRGDVEAITWRLSTVLHLRQLLEPHAGFQVYLLRRQLLQYVLFATKIALAQTSPEVSFMKLEDLLAKTDDPSQDLRRALVEERAIGNEVFESLSSVDVRTPRPWSLESIWLDTDQAVYLDTLSSAIDALDEPQIDQTEERIAALDADLSERASSKWARLTPVTMMLVPKLENSWIQNVSLRAELSLVRLGLRLRTLGEGAACAEAAHSLDPWCGRPVHCRVDPDGILVLWSVGPNHRDEGAPLTLDAKSAESRERSRGKEFDDIAVRVRLR